MRQSQSAVRVLQSNHETWRARASAIGNVAVTLQQAALHHGARPALSHGKETRLDYRGFAERSARIAGGLRSAGLMPGDTVGLVMINCIDYLPVLYGIWHAGLVAVPINTALPPDEARWLLANARVRLCFVSPRLAGGIAPLADELEHLDSVIVLDSDEFARLAAHEPIPVAKLEQGAEAPAWLFYTSGTTGRPKGAVLSHHNLLIMAMGYFTDGEPITPEDCLFHVVPMSHAAGMFAIPHVMHGANHVIPASGGFAPNEIMDLLGTWPGASICMAPVMINMLVAGAAASPERLRPLKTVVYGSAPMYLRDLERAISVLGPKFIQFYGLGEAPAGVACLSKADHAAEPGQPRRAERLVSAGRVRTGAEVRVIDARGNDVPAGEVGQIICRSDVVMQGYLGDKQATTATLRDGWLYTGDMGVLDADGYLTVMGRLRDAIVTAAATIYPREIEEVVLRHPMVREVAVVGHRDVHDADPAVVAFVAASAPVTWDELDALCRGHLPREKCPGDYVFVDALPKNNYGKVLKTELERSLADRVAAPVAADPGAPPWQRHDMVTPEGYRVRVASSMADAEKARAVLRSAWRVNDSEPYFYDAFDDARTVFRDVIEPALRTHDIRQLRALCVVGEDQDGQLLSTISMIFGHERGEVELGRGGVANDARGLRISRYHLAHLERLLSLIPEYVVFADATTLIQGAGIFAEKLGVPAVAFYPSTFTVQRSCVDEWWDRLTGRHDAELARALLMRSEVTGLGRFATGYHLRLPAERAVYRPHLTAIQEPFYKHTTTVLAPAQNDGPQFPVAAGPRVQDRPYTATRTMTEPVADLDLDDCVRAAAEDGFETIIMNVPCDEPHLTLSRRLEDAGAVVSGVYPDSSGRWHAGYTLFTTESHRRQVMQSLRILHRRKALIDSQMAVLQHIIAQYA